jgi:hypothetical protein
MFLTIKLITFTLEISKCDTFSTTVKLAFSDWHFTSLIVRSGGLQFYMGLLYLRVTGE